MTLRAEVVRPAELGAEDLAAWRHLQAVDPGLRSPFLSPEFALAIGEARGDARVAVVSDGDGPAGYFAFQVGIGRVGSPIGATICDAQAFVCRADLQWDALDLVTASGLDNWSFDHLRVEQRAFEPFHRTRHRAPVIDLTHGHDAFLTAVREQSKDVVSQVARRRRKLAREVGEVTTTWSNPADRDAYATLLEWKSAQYAATGVWDRFGHPWIVDALEHLRAAEAPGCTGVLATTRAGDRLAAVHFGLVGTDSLSWWFPAYDHELAAYSPGLILLLDLAEQAAEGQLARIDLGRGEHDYKLRVATESYEVAEGEVTGS